MALDKTVLMVADKNTIKVFDKHLSTKLYEFNVTDSNHEITKIVFNEKNSDVWVLTSDDKVSCYEVSSSNAASKFQSDSISNLRYSDIIINTKNNKAYVVNGYQYKAYLIDRENGIETQLSIPNYSNLKIGSYRNNSTADTYYYSGEYSPVNDKVIIIFYHSANGENMNYPSTAWGMILEPDLSNYTLMREGDIGGVGGYKRNVYFLKGNAYGPYYKLDQQYGMYKKHIVYNKYKNRITAFFAREYYEQSSHIRFKLTIDEFNPENNSRIGFDARLIPGYDEMHGDDTRYDIDDIIDVVVDEYSGDYLIATAQRNVFRIDMNFKYIRKESTAFNSAWLGFNHKTQEYYAHADDRLVVKTLDGSRVAEGQEGEISDLKYAIVAVSLNESTRLGVFPSKIVMPSYDSVITDTTPTIIFKVGNSLESIAQQFRIAADRDIDKIVNQGYDYSYERIWDTWANGDNYKKDDDGNPLITFYYSTDYDETSEDENNGTWNELGTGDGVQSGGSEPDNGIIATGNRDVYVKFTIPDDENERLEGADTNVKWYFKIYTYSKIV